MAKRLKNKSLNIFVGSTKLGQYMSSSSGATSFRYDGEWLNRGNAFPVSLSLPLSTRIFTGQNVSSYFEGLLPDNDDVRDKIAARERIESSSTFDILSAIGHDCVGCLRFLDVDLHPGNPQKMDYLPISDEEIADKISQLNDAPLGLKPEQDFRISIAGVQEKTALLKIENEWSIPLGATPTSHIFKPPMKSTLLGVDFSDIPWNEWACLHLCRALGLEAANSEVKYFNKKAVIIVERFDRQWIDGVLYRLPQEDLCQALAVPTNKKYQSDGGPGMIQILNLLDSSAIPRKDKLTFIKAQIVFWLLAAIDGHAKNFSIFHTPGGFKLTPLYDVISIYPYPKISQHKAKLAMSVGNNNHYLIKKIMPRHFYQTGKKVGLRDGDIDDCFNSIIQKVDESLNHVERISKKHNAPFSTVDAILSGVEKKSRLLKNS